MSSITNHVEIQTTTGTSWCNLTDEDTDSLKYQLENAMPSSWIQIGDRYFSPVNVISMTILLGKWKKPQRPPPQR